MVTTYSFPHPTIGEVKGKPVDDRIVQFRGLQYATLTDRFSPPALKRYDKKGVVDGTKLGPQTLCHAPGPDFEQTHLLQHTLDYDRSTQFTHDLDGLNLNITAPLGASGQLYSDRQLPVFCFIHGGGFNGGSAAFPQYDMARFVRVSVEKGTPIIAVTPNYRLNAPGFLTSEELRAAGYETNNAFRDQRTAIEWIKQHIAGFGGDAENLTLAGESAGAVSVNYCLLSPEPLFKRVMLMSGSCLLMAPIALKTAEANYQRAIQALGLEDVSREERIQSLLTMDGIELCGRLVKAGIPSQPVLDQDIIDASPTFERITTAFWDIPGRSWCKSALIGDVQFDGNIQALRLQHRKRGIARQIYDSFESSLGIETAAKVLQAYDIHRNTANDDDNNDDETFQQILELCTDIQFYAPTLSLAANLSTVMPTYLYRFNEPNPWDPPPSSAAHPLWPPHRPLHIQDVTWLLQNFNDFLAEPQRRQAREFAEAVVTFVHGVRHPWQAWRVGRKVAKIVGPGGGVGTVGWDEAPGNGRRGTVVELARGVGMDRLSEALGGFMEGG